MVDVIALIKTPDFLLKIVELLVAVICTGLISGHQIWASALNEQVIVATLIGYIPVNILVITGFCINHPLHKLLVLMVTVSGAILYLVSGALLFVSYDEHADGVIIGAAILALGNAVVYSLDTFITYKYGAH